MARSLVALVETARRVSRARDYSVRAVSHPDHYEIAVVVKAFNEMPEQIRERDIALNRVRESPEACTQERTAALRAAIVSWRHFHIRRRTTCADRSMQCRGMVYL